MFATRLRLYSSAQLTHYQVLELSPSASLQDIKQQFKRLLKKYHPDLNAHLSEEEKEANSRRYVEMVLAYDTLKDRNRKRDYDLTLSQLAPRPQPSAWRSQYYGEAKYYSRGKASASYTSRGYNATRHRVHNFYDGDAPRGHFAGHHRNHSDRFDVPHFNYHEHLLKHLKFEQRLINKDLSAADREAIIRQLAPDGDLLKVDEELITKHMMRQARKFARPADAARPRASGNPHMYQGPHGAAGGADGGLGLTAAVVAGGAGSAYLIYQTILG